jgi:hypothetical protein
MYENNMKPFGGRELNWNCMKKKSDNNDFSSLTTILFVCNGEIFVRIFLTLFSSVFQADNSIKRCGIL